MTEEHATDDQKTAQASEPKLERTEPQNAKAEIARRAGLPEDERNSYTTPTE